MSHRAHEEVGERAGVADLVVVAHGAENVERARGDKIDFPIGVINSNKVLVIRHSK